MKCSHRPRTLCWPLHSGYCSKSMLAIRRLFLRSFRCTVPGPLQPILESRPATLLRASSHHLLFPGTSAHSFLPTLSQGRPIPLPPGVTLSRHPSFILYHTDSVPSVFSHSLCSQFSPARNAESSARTHTRTHTHTHTHTHTTMHNSRLLFLSQRPALGRNARRINSGLTAHLNERPAVTLRENESTRQDDDLSASQSAGFACAQSLNKRPRRTRILPGSCASTGSCITGGTSVHQQC